MKYILQAVMFLLFSATYIDPANSSIRLTERLEESDFSQWLKKQEAASKEYLLANISPSDTLPGTVVAASSRANPNYYYHWVRDAGLTMLTISKMAQRDETLWKYLEDFATLTKKHQDAWAPAGLGEVKFNIDGTPFTGPWGRPQNDGPAIRALALMELAAHLIQNGEENRVRELLYNPDYPATTIIKKDLEYVSHNWTYPDFDLWEEVRGGHFFTRLMQRRALLQGAKLADQFGDPGASQWYRWQAALLSSQIEEHWDNSKKLFLSTLNRNGGVDYKQGADSSTVLGTLAHFRADDTFMALSDTRVQTNFHNLSKIFFELYPINSKYPDFAPGIGRYPEDRYDGYATNRQGHAWFLITAAFAQYCYELSMKFFFEGQISVDENNREFIEKAFILGQKNPLHDEGIGPNPGIKTIERSQHPETFFQIIEGMKTLGDKYLHRIYLHASEKGNLSEQFNRYNGSMQGAENLTWSYANFLEALMAREQANQQIIL